MKVLHYDKKGKKKKIKIKNSAGLWEVSHQSHNTKDRKSFLRHRQNQTQQTLRLHFCLVPEKLFSFFFFLLLGEKEIFKKSRHTPTIKSVSKRSPVIRKKQLFSLYIQACSGQADAVRVRFPTKDSEIVTNCSQFTQSFLGGTDCDPFNSPIFYDYKALKYRPTFIR